MRNEIESILKNRHTGDLNAIVDIVTGAIVKEIGLRLAMERSGISLNLLLAAYSFCGKHIALDKVQLVDMADPTSQNFLNGVLDYTSTQFLRNTSISKVLDKESHNSKSMVIFYTLILTNKIYLRIH